MTENESIKKINASYRENGNVKFIGSILDTENDIRNENIKNIALMVIYKNINNYRNLQVDIYDIANSTCQNGGPAYKFVCTKSFNDMRKTNKNEDSVEQLLEKFSFFNL
jgi:hypothetical protein